MSSFNFKEALSDVSHKTKSGVSTLRTKTQHTPASTKNATANEEINARPLAALKDPKSFPAPPVHRVAHGMQPSSSPAPAAPAAYQQPPAAYGQPPAAYGQPPVPAYGQPPAAYGQPPVPAYGQPPAPAYGQPPVPAYGQPPAPYGQLPASTPQYAPPVATPSSPVPPTSQYTPPVTSQYQPPSATYTPPASYQTYSHSGVQPEQPQPPAFQPPVPNNYVPPGNGPQGTYQSPGVHVNPPLPPASARPPPPPRSVSAVSAESANPAQPEPPARAPLPDPSSFPKPPPIYGYRASEQTPPAPPSRASSGSTPVSTYKPQPPPGLPGLPPRAVPAVPVASPVIPVASPVPVSAPVPVLAPVPVASPVSSLPPRTPPVVGQKPHKKPPPPPVKPKKFGSHQPPAPAADHINSPPPPYAQKHVPAATHNPMFEQQQASASAIAAQLNQINLSATDSNRSIEKTSTGGGSIRDKIKALNSSQPNFASQIAGQFNHAESHHNEEQHNVDAFPKPFKKAAPPPPAKKKPAVPPPVASRPVSSPVPAPAASPTAVPAETPKGTPPPINFSTRPKGYELPATPPVESTPSQIAAPAPEPPKPGQKEFDLQLHTLWFAQPTIQLPPTLAGLNYTYSIVKSNAECALTLAIRISEDLSIVKYRITWPGNVSGPALAAAAKQKRKELPPPPTLTQAQLIQAYEQFGNGVAAFGESVIGQQVGDGECWTLAKEAIDQSSHGFAMSPVGYTHGALVYHAVGGASAPIAYNDSIRRGDILQFTSGKFETRDPVTGAVRATSNVGNPNHTSIVTNVSPNNRIVDIVHQNVSGSRKVQPGQHNLDEFVAGDVKIFRPVWKEWAGELDTTF